MQSWRYEAQQKFALARLAIAAKATDLHLQDKSVASWML